jgi:hypothetical protein
MLRAIAEKYHHLGPDEIEKLLKSRIHEYRFIGLLILVARCEGGDESTKRRVFSFYLNHTRCVNNRDLLDASGPAIMGEHLVSRPRRILYMLDLMAIEGKKPAKERAANKPAARPQRKSA